MTSINQPTPLSRQQIELIKTLGNWELSLSLLEFQSRWDVDYQQLADICGVQKSTVESWHKKLAQRNYPSKYVLMRLAIADKLLRGDLSKQILHFLEIYRSHNNQT